MANLPLGDLKLVLDDLFTKRHAELKSSQVGRAYEAKLKAIRAEIDALAPAQAGGRPLAAELAATDQIHDGLGAAIFHMATAYADHPTADAEVRKAALRIREKFVPRLGELKKPYAVEAATAAESKKQLGGFKADLARFPVAGKQTLFDWVSAFIAAGERLGVIMSERGDVNRAADVQAAGKAGLLRSRAQGLLGRARAAIGDEDEQLEKRLFAYYDELAALAAKPTAKKASPAAPASPPMKP